MGGSYFACICTIARDLFILGEAKVRVDISASMRRDTSSEVVLREVDHDGWVKAIVWSPDGALLANGGFD